MANAQWHACVMPNAHVRALTANCYIAAPEPAVRCGGGCGCLRRGASEALAAGNRPTSAAKRP
ncbi:MAG: hypothetical protein MUC60_04965 [Oscillatoria sp. Prado101]|nr:hypothetical protein [Oscillatoria sp. Prado101]